MCGLSGVFKRTHLASNERKAFIELGQLSFFRGTDSAGVAVLTKKKMTSTGVGHRIIKSVDHAVDFFRQKEVLSEIHNNKAVCLMGHARAATHGDINETNAQPMRSGHIIGTHNGVLKRYAPTKEEEANFTDSRKLFEAFASSDVPKVLDGLFSNDSYALVWVDTIKNTINFVRNERRPLFICRSDNKALFWSSDQMMIAFALIRNDVSYETITEVPEDVLLSINMTTGVSTKVDLKEKKKEGEYPFTYRRVYTPDTSTATSATAHLSSGTSVPTLGPTTNIVRVVPRGELTPPSIQAAATHAGLQQFLNKTKEAYEKGQSSVLAPDNVIPFVTREQNEALVKRSEASESLLGKEEEQERQLEEQIDAACFPFLKRPAREPSVSDSSAHNLDKASYKLRKYGIDQWVSILVAESHLRHGCKTCNCKPTVEDKVYWKDPSNYYCDECFNDENIRDFMKIKPEDYTESDIMLDTHVSLYGG